ncbi:hypothetical protein KC19_4G075300, partial [Ceratodon purpureus]
IFEKHIINSKEEDDNSILIKNLYEAILKEDVVALKSYLSLELDWWYHGPPGHQHMKFLLTGISRCKAYVFNPDEIRAIGNRVFVEGPGRTPSGSWIHIWTIKDNLCVVLREYSNTAIMVTNVTPIKEGSIGTHDVFFLWQSRLARIRDANIPSIVLTIDVTTS